MTPAARPLTSKEMADLATRLVKAWGTDRFTQPTQAELDLARWIMERVDEDPELAMAKAALESWSTRLRAIQTALGQRAGGVS